MAADAGLEFVKSLITHHENFPAPGILFHDVFPIFRNPRALEIMVAHLLSMISAKHPKVDAIVGLDARGFLFGPILAQRLQCAFVPVRKGGKLPGPCISVSSTKEYGKGDVQEIQSGAFEPGAVCVIVDDLLATGGTLLAASTLVEKLGGVVAGCYCIVELAELNGAARVGRPCAALFTMPAGC
eukprot:m.223041 g.223041  ORF g.223041 m.223041 type:complete len:184 (+) comp16162_c0_seq1:29-580(+)